MKDVVITTDTNNLGEQKFRWYKYFFDTLMPGYSLRLVRDIKDIGNPDIIICEDIMRSNPGCSEKIYNRSRILEYGLNNNIQTHLIAQDVSMEYFTQLERNRGDKIYAEDHKDNPNFFVWYGVDRLEQLDMVKSWKLMRKKIGDSHSRPNIGSAISYLYMKNHQEEMREGINYPDESVNVFGYYGYWRKGILKDSVINSGIDHLIGTFKWRPFCEDKDISFETANKTFEYIFSRITKSYIPYEYPKADVQFTSRQYEGIILARDGVEYDDNFPEEKKIYSMESDILKETYSPILKEFINVLKTEK